MNWSKVRLLPSGKHLRVWAVPGNGVICLINSQTPPLVGTVCTNDHVAQHHGVYTTFLAEGDGQGTTNRLIVGITPKDVDRVQIRTGATVKTSKVSEGRFIVRDNSNMPPDEVTLVMRSALNGQNLASS